MTAEFVLAVVLGLLFAAGTFLVMRRDIVRVVWGVAIIGQSANVFLVTMGGLSGSAPIVAHGGGGTGATDPLVQALVLTAIVIGFGTTAFALVLSYRVYQEHNTIDVSELDGGEGDVDGADGGGGGDAGRTAGRPVATLRGGSDD